MAPSHAGGELQAMRIPDLDGTDLSAVAETGTMLRRRLGARRPSRDPGRGRDAVRAQRRGDADPEVRGHLVGANGSSGSSRRTAAARTPRTRRIAARRAHGGQIWRYDPKHERLELVATFGIDDDFEGPDNITVSPYGYAVMCTDGEDDRQFLAGITRGGGRSRWRATG